LREQFFSKQQYIRGRETAPFLIFCIGGIDTNESVEMRESDKEGLIIDTAADYKDIYTENKNIER